MIDHLIFLETGIPIDDGDYPDQATLETWDSQGKPKRISFPARGANTPNHTCHTVFQLAAEGIESFLDERKVRLPFSRLVVVVDFAVWDELNPLDTAGEFIHAKASSVVSLLILSFPEALWCFGNLEGVDTAPAAIRRMHDWARWKRAGNVPPVDALLDTSGLRNYIRYRAERHRLEKANKPVPAYEIPSWALAMDDEPTYAYFNAYVQYRHGLCAAPIASWSAADFVLREIDGELWHPSPVLSFEDLYMSFPDVPSDSETSRISLSDLNERDKRFPLLKHIPAGLRVIVTSGAVKLATWWGKIRAKLHALFPRSNWFKSPAHVQGRLTDQSDFDRQRTERGAELMFKPVAGMFYMWNNDGMGKHDIFPGSEPARKAGVVWRNGYKVGFNSEEARLPPQAGIPHSAPGAILTVASGLIVRARKLSTEFSSVEDVVLGAVLATDALELLANQTPTMSLDALIMKHELEVRAECLFHGVQNHFDVKSRLEDIRNTLKTLSVSYTEEHQEIARWNGEAAALKPLKNIFGEYEQFEEEESYTARSRKLHRMIWFRQLNGDSVIGKIIFAIPNLILWYVGVLLSGILRFVAAVVLCISLLSIGFGFVEVSAERARADAQAAIMKEAAQTRRPAPASSYEPEPLLTIGANAFTNAFSSFVSVGPPMSDSSKECSQGMRYLAQFLACLGMGLGFLHLGVFISHVYSVVSRKK